VGLRQICIYAGGRRFATELFPTKDLDRLWSAYWKDLCTLPGRPDLIQTDIFRDEWTAQTCRDIAAILKANRDKLEFEYIEAWVVQLGLGSTWKELKDSIE
jgi:hypothetical protein